MDFGDLIEDKAIQEKLTNFQGSIEKIEKMLDTLLQSNIYDTLSTEDKVHHDLFLTFTLNTLYWLYLRSKGENPNENEVKSQLSRVKEYMLKHKQAIDNNKNKLRLNVAVAKRFIKHELGSSTGEKSPPNKKTKFE